MLESCLFIHIYFNKKIIIFTFHNKEHGKQCNINYIKYLLISLFDIWECYIYYFNSIMQISITKTFNTQLNTLESSTIYLKIPLYNFVNKINIVHPLYKVFHQWLCSYNTVVCRSVTFCNPQSSANKIKIEALVGISK